MDNKIKYSSNKEDNQSELGCNNNYGPIFGSGNDLVIFDNSNQNNCSFSNLGTSYGKSEDGDKTSLAGSN